MDELARIVDARPADGDPILQRALESLRSRITNGSERRLSRYRLIREIGTGGFGTVWSAFDPWLRREVAIKTLSCDKSNLDPRVVQREAQALAQLGHPNVVACYDVGLHGDTVFFAMELVQGCDLAKWLERPHSTHEILGVFADAAAGLTAAHRLGIVHRDFKPANVLVGVDGRARVTDFGLASFAPTVADAPSSDDSDELGGCGTLPYMAPEQHAGHGDTPAVDVFAFAATLYEAFAGVRAFGGRTALALMTSKRDRDLSEPGRGREIPAAVRAAVQIGLDPDPLRRPSVAAVMARAQIRHGPVRRALGVSATVVLATALWERAPEPDACAATTPRLETVATEAELAEGLQTRWDAIEAARADTCSAFARGDIAKVVRDAQLRCFARKFVDVTAFAQTLAAADVPLADRALALAELEGPQACIRAAPADSSAGSVGSESLVHEQLARARAANAVENSTDARAAAHDALALAVDHGHAGLEAEALLERGRAASKLLDPEAAYQDLQQAFWLAQGHGDDRTAAAAAVALVFVAGKGRGDPTDSARWERHADTQLDRIGRGDWLEATLWDHRALLSTTRGEHEAALRADERALELWRSVVPTDSPAMVRPLLTHSVTLGGAGQPDAALAAAMQAHELASRGAASDDAIVLRARILVATALGRLNRFDEAGAESRELLAVLEHRFGPDDERTYTVRGNLARLLIRQGQPDAARPHFEQLLATTRRLRGERHPDTALMLAQVAGLYPGSGVAEPPRAELLAAVEIFESLERPDLRVTEVYGALATGAHAAGRADETVQWLRKAAAVTHALLPDAHPHRLIIDGYLAVAEIARKPAVDHTTDLDPVRARMLAAGLPRVAAAYDLSAALECLVRIAHGRGLGIELRSAGVEQIDGHRARHGVLHDTGHQHEFFEGSRDRNGADDGPMVRGSSCPCIHAIPRSSFSSTRSSSLAILHRAASSGRSRRRAAASTAEIPAKVKPPTPPTSAVATPAVPT